MFNPIAIITALIAPAGELPAAEIDFADDSDTQEVPVIAMHLTPLSEYPHSDAHQLINARVQYRHFDTSRDLFTGKVTAANGNRVLITPDAGQDARYERWRDLADVTAYVHFE
jgi:hypothetical protein